MSQGFSTEYLVLNGQNLTATGNTLYINNTTISGGPGGSSQEEIIVVCSDQYSLFVAAAGVAYFRMPFQMNLTGVKASLYIPCSGSSTIIDINQSGSSILSSGLYIDTGELTSLTSQNFATISYNTLTGDAEIRIDIDQVGSTYAGIGLEVSLLGTRL